MIHTTAATFCSNSTEAKAGAPWPAEFSTGTRVSCINAIERDRRINWARLANALILWNTRYMDAAVRHLKNSGAVVREPDLQGLSPLGHRHVHLLGRYRFLLDGPSLTGEMRPLRTDWNTKLGSLSVVFGSNTTQTPI
jgi:hypothetical protein